MAYLSVEDEAIFFAACGTRNGALPADRRGGVGGREERGGFRKGSRLSEPKK
jgi:hypothetical protein